MKKLGFLGKQVLVYSLLMLVVVAVLIFFAHSYVMDVSREKAVIIQEQLTTAALEKVDAYLDQVMLIASQVAHDSEIVAVMEQLDSPENNAVVNYFEVNSEAHAHMADLLNSHNTPNAPVFCIDVYNSHGDYISTLPTLEDLRTGRDFFTTGKFDNHLYKSFVTENRSYIMMGPDPRGLLPDFAPENTVYMMMPIKSPDGTQIYGYLNVYQPLEPLFEQLDVNQQSGIDVYLFYEVNQVRGNQFYPRDLAFPDLSSGDYYETERRSQYWWYVVLLQDQAEFLASYQNMLVYLYLGGAAMLMLLLLCVYLLVRYTSKPILALNSRVKKATLTNFPDRPVSDHSLDEVKELEQSVDHMLQRIKTSVELEQQAYLKALQAQMRPHFLYNCLSTISSLGVEADSPTIPRFCSHLAAILRYEATYESGQATLTEEIENVRNYLELMKIRYEDDVSYALEVDPGLETLPLPRLVLQPLVENAFEHGFRAVEPPWYLTVRAFRLDNQWMIQVCDNGIGFDEETRIRLMEQAEQLSEHLGENYAALKIGGLGLVNTIVRLRLMSRGHVSFSISANQPCGTIITLRGELRD